LPVPVILKRFLAPDFVFSLGILLSWALALFFLDVFVGVDPCEDASRERKEPPRQPITGRAVQEEAL
jgi:hypothetical protein